MPLSLFAPALLAIALGASSPAAALTAPAAFPRLDSQVCGNLVPCGLLPPAGGFTSGCARRFSLKLGAAIGPDGNYILLGYPACGAGTCAGQTGIAGMQCEAAGGYDCCLATGDVVSTIQGTNVGLFQTALNQRIASDPDARSGICFADYAGSGARVVIAPIIQLQSSNTQAALLGFVAVFLTSPSTGTGTATTFTVEVVSLDATPATSASWGRLKRLYR